MELGSTLCNLDSTLSAAAARMAPEVAAPRLSAQLEAAFLAIQHCCAVVALAELSREEVARFAQCGMLLMGGSVQAQLSSWLKQVQPPAPPVRRRRRRAVQQEARSPSPPESLNALLKGR